MIIAKVIVDVPAKQTNRAFDYIVPEVLDEFIDIGSRVAVPFGPRKIQGFVISLHDESDVERSKLREIEDVLDLRPPLNEELIQLARWMSEKYVCHQIVAMQAMIPSALKARYKRYITMGEQADGVPFKQEQHAELLSYIMTKNKVETSELLTRFPGQGAAIKSLLDSGVIAEVQTVLNRVGKKKEAIVCPPASAALQRYLQDIPTNAKRQRQVLEFFSDHPEPLRLADLTADLGVAAQTVRQMAEKGYVSIAYREVFRDPYAHRDYAPSPRLTLTAEQSAVFETICKPLMSRQHAAFLLHGITGSGKTEVYLQAIEQCLQTEREAIVLVPEISLTPQMVERFKGRFGDLVAVLHSRLSHGERYDEWRKIHGGRVKIVIGARSAIFAPFKRLGLIIMDEEHESSYKQEDSPKYHARDIALQRGKTQGAVVVLGSATPSLETFHRRDVQRLTMLSRIENRPLPTVQIVDMRRELGAGNRSMFSRALHEAIGQRLQKGEQIVLMLNRRGFSTFIMCRSCGYVCTCPHCDIALTYHRTARHLRCHYCGHAERELNTCPQCHSAHIRYFGTGTQRVEEQLQMLFPELRIVRMDVDTTTEKHAHEKLLAKFGSGEADVLLGTQMVAKGLDFPNVTLVGVIAADTILHLPDFRAAERTFQLLTQVAGRAGRHELPGEVIIQTYNPGHYSIAYAREHDYEQFAAHELKLRQARRYPPFRHLILITLSHEHVAVLVRMGEQLAAQLRRRGQQLAAGMQGATVSAGMHQHNQQLNELRASGGPPLMEVLGPVASPLPRIKDRYRFQCVVKYGGEQQVISLISETIALFAEASEHEDLHISVDVDPQILM